MPQDKRCTNSDVIATFLPKVVCSSCQDDHSADFFFLYIHVITMFIKENTKHYLKVLFP